MERGALGDSKFLSLLPAKLRPYVKDRAEGLFPGPWDTLPQTGHLDTDSLTAVETLCPVTEVLGGALSLDAQRELVLLAIMYLFMPTYLFRDGAILRCRGCS